MELINMYDVIKSVVMTEKSSHLFDQFGQITLEVDRSANKLVIRKAVEKIWDVKVARVRVMNRAGKNKRSGRRAFTSSSKKRAIITLKEGYSIDMPGQFESMGPAQSTESEGR